MRRSFTPRKRISWLLYFILAAFVGSAQTPAPGGVHAGLKQWLRGDLGVTVFSGGRIDHWYDQSGNGGGYNMGDLSSPSRPVYNTTTNLVNFNPTVGFVNDNLLVTCGSLFSDGYYYGLSAFALVQTNTLPTGDSSYLFKQAIRVNGVMTTFGMALPNTDGKAVWDGPGSIRVSGPWGGVLGVPYLWSGVNGNNTETLSRNGYVINAGTSTSGFGNTPPYNMCRYLGSSSAGTSNFNSLAAEIAIYDSALTATQVQQIQSYYALKYGITLSQSPGPANYLASDGTTVVWNAVSNAAYNADIAGIGRDDGSGLTQKQSRSVNTTNSGNMLTIGLGTIAASNAANASAFGADKSFLVWGDNGASVAGGDNILDLPTGYSRRVNRLWRAQVTGTGVGQVQVQLDLTGITHAGSAAGDFVLLIKRGGSNPSVLNESGATYVATPAASYSSGVVTFNGVSFQNNDVFALVDASGPPVNSVAPGGVSSGLTLWLRADAGVTASGSSVSGWNDQSGWGNHVSQANAAQQPVYNTTSGLVNFNPTLGFSNTIQNLSHPGGIFGAGPYTAVNCFALAQTNAQSQNTAWGFAFYQALSNGTGFGMNLPFADGSAVWDGPGADRVYVPWGGTLGVPYLWSGLNNNNTQILQRNRVQVNTTGTSIVSFGNTNSSNPFVVGNDHGPSASFSGSLGEIVVYANALTAGQIQQIQSYYALKYGITLDQSSSPYSYLASNGTTVVWDATANGGFKNNIAGIGRDDNSTLNQKQSQSVNTAGYGNMLTIGLGAVALSNAANTGTFGADRSFLVWGDNGGDVTGGDNSTDLPTGYSRRVNRLWKAQVTGTGVGPVQVRFDLSSIAHAGTTTGQFVLLIKRGGSNSGVLNESGAGYVAISAASYASGVVTFNGVNFQNNDIFALIDGMTPPAGVAAPGGVTAGLQQWLRADAGVTAANGAISQWNDQSGNGFDMPGVGGPTYNTSASLVNFNPSVTLSNNGYFRSLLPPLFQNGTYTGAGVFAIVQTNAAPSGLTPGSFLTQSILANGTLTNFGLSLPDINGNAVWDGPGTNSVSAAWGGALGVPYLWSGVNGNNMESLRRNGFQIAGAARSATFSSTLNGLYEIIGSNVTGVSNFNSLTTEIAIYGSALTPTQVQQIQSYYAIKYGITLDQSSPNNYLASDGTTVVWNATANSGYNNNIAGIGKDDRSLLSQKQSRSINTTGNGNMLTIGLGTIAASNATNTASFGADRSFLVWGDNGAGVTGGDNSTDLPAGYLRRINRLWKVQLTGNGVGQVQVQLDLSGIGHAGSAAGNFVLLIKRGGSSSGVLNESGATYVAVRAASYSSGIVTFNGVTFQNNDIFALADSLGLPPRKVAPGGVSNGLAMWLRADAGVAASAGAVTTWSDLSSGINYPATGKPAYNTTASMVNFNPTVGLKSGTYFRSSGTLFPGGTYNGAATFAVVQTNAIPTGSDVSAYLLKVQINANDAFGVALPLGNGNAAWDGPASVGVKAPWGGTVGMPYLWSGLNGNNAQSLRRNGYQIGSGTAPSSFTTTGAYFQTLGGAYFGSFNYNLVTPEIIVYRNALTPVQVQQIQSYHALKYGITLDQTTPYNYLASDSTMVVWDATANGEFNHNIAGIGKDSIGALNQKQSQSVNTAGYGNMLTIGLGSIAATNAGNGNSFGSDLSFLVWGDDGGDVTAPGFNTAVPGNYPRRINRLWKAQVTGTGVGPVQVQFNLTGIPHAGTATSHFVLLILRGRGIVRSFGNVGGNYIAVQAASYSSGVVTFNGVSFQNNDIFALVDGYGIPAVNGAPGGVSSGLQQWLRADANVTLTAGGYVDEWRDQSGNGYHMGDIPNSNRPVYNTTTNLVNFNPTVGFTGYTNLFTSGSLFSDPYYSGVGAFALVQTNSLPTGDPSYIYKQYLTVSGVGTSFGLALPSTDGNAIWDGPGTVRVSAPWGGTLGVPYLWSGLNANNMQSLRRNGYQIGNGTSVSVFSNDPPYNNGKIFGCSSAGTANFNSLAGELAIYKSPLTPTQVQQIQSYYAIKYGITLDQTNPYNYLASDGTTVIWNATTNSAYSHNIAGIGKDTASMLNQKQSRSVNTAGKGDMLTIGLGAVAVSNAANTASFSAERSFLVWGDNGGSVAGGDNSTDLPTGYSSRVNRLWKTQVTGVGVGQVEVTFDLNGVVHAGAGSGDFVLLIKRGGSNSTVLKESGATYVPVTATSYAAGVVTFDGVSFQDGDVFALMDGIGSPSIGPGGVSDGLKLWLRGDAGVTASGSTVSQWNDQSGTGNNLSQSDASIQPVYNTTSRLVNFNPTLGFAGNYQYLSDPDGIFGAGPYTAANCFVMAQTDVLTANPFQTYAFGQPLTQGGGYGMVLGDNTNEVTWAGPSLSGSLNNEYTVLWDGTLGVPYLWSGLNNNNTESLRRNGIVLNAGPSGPLSGNNPISYGNTDNSNAFWIGNMSDQGPAFTGLLGEMAVYTSTLTPTQIQQIQSYYALKYGLTLNQTSPYNYLASNGTTIVWNATANSGYNNNIAGIGLDNNGMLNQKQSRSVNTTGNGNMLTIGLGTIAISNAANTASFGADKSYLVWGDNGGSVTGGDNSTDLPAGYVSRVNRLWKAQVTGMGVGQVQVQLDLTGISHAGTTSGNFKLLIKRGGSNSSVLNESGATYVPVAATSYAGGIVTFDGVSFQDGDVFALVDSSGSMLAAAATKMSAVSTAAKAGNDLPTGSIAPNPFRNSLTIRFSEPGAGPVVMSLVNTNGQEVRQRTWTAAAGENVVEWNGLERLTPGFYVLTIKGNDRTVSYKVVKIE